MVKTQKYFKQLEKIEKDFYKNVDNLERKMRKETGIKDIEFFWCDNSIVGIGNADRTMKLIHRR